MTRVDFRKAFRGEALRRAQSPMAPPNLADSAMPAPTPPPVWQRVLRAPFSLVRRFLVGSLHIKIDHLTRTVATTRQSVKELENRFQLFESMAENRLQGLESLLVNRLHHLDIKVRAPHEYDTDTDAIRLNDGYVLVPKRARKLRLLLADAPPDGLEPGTSQVIRRLLSKGMTAVDIGANVGALTLVCARAVGQTGKVYAFEPEPEFADLLTETFDLNGTDWVELHRTAIGRVNDQTTFHISPISGHSSIYPLPASEAAQQVDIQVQVRRLDDVIGSTTRVDLVKMDVEGAELDVLGGMSRLLEEKADLTIVAEYGRSHLSRQGLDPAFWADQFLSHGYSMFAIDEMSGRCEPTSATTFGEKESVNIAMARFGTRAYDLLSGFKPKASATSLPQKIALCTPLSSHSAIALASKILAAELERRHQFVSLINIELEIPKTEGATSSSLWWKDPKAAAALESADAIVVQIGDNYAYHAGAIEILSRFRCIGIFHDANIYNLFRMWAFDEGSTAEGQARHDRQLAAIYGDELQICEKPDLLRWLASQCAAALVHADFYMSAIRDYCPGPVAKSRLAYDARPVANSARRSDRFTVLTLGHINANKCCSEVIEGIAALEIKPSIEYRLAGPIAEAEQEKLAVAASAHGVELTILGRVSDEEMAQELGRADVVCCLRRPVLEGASASAIEAMLSSRPIIVADSGFYAEIDEAAAIKLPANFGVPDITQALNRLISDDALRESLGRRARAWASEECSLSHYTDVLEELISAAVAATPYLELARTYADQLSELGFNEQDAVSSEIADRLQELCSDEQS